MAIPKTVSSASFWFLNILIMMVMLLEYLIALNTRNTLRERNNLKILNSLKLLSKSMTDGNIAIRSMIANGVKG